MDKTNAKLLKEVENAKKMMNFLDNNKNYNRSFFNCDIIKEDVENTNDQYGSPENKSDKLILGADETSTESLQGTSFIVISTDVNGELYVNLVEAEDEQSAMQKSENELLTQMLVLNEGQLISLVTKLTKYLPEEINAQTEPVKPPFIDESKKRK
jgi:hypothetical protein